MKPIKNVNNKIIVIADDLTGANDTGVQFAKQGLATTVLLNAYPSLAPRGEDVVVVNTQSRSLAPEEAYQKVMTIAASIQGDQYDIIYKKIDSTLRGNIGREIDAVMDACNLDVAVVVPAFPKNGRTTAGGYYFLHGIPLEATEIARDPTCPIRESHIPTLLSKQTGKKIAHIGLKDITTGSASILESLKKMFSEDVKIVVCDAWQEKHLQDIAAAVFQVEKRVLWVGSAGLAEYLPSAIRNSSSIVAENPVLVIAGSVSGVTREQIAKLAKQPDTVYVEVDPCALLQNDTASTEITRCHIAADSAVAAGSDVIITSANSDDIVERTNAKGNSLGFAGHQIADMVAAALGDLCHRIAITNKLSGLVLTGGDTALSCCNRLSASGFSVVKEIAPGIPLGLLKGGPCNGQRVVTKAGAFGDEDVLCIAVDSLKLYNKEKNGEPQHTR